LSFRFHSTTRQTVQKGYMSSLTVILNDSLFDYRKDGSFL